MVSVRDHHQIEPQPWVECKDKALPRDLKSIFLRADLAPRCLFGGVICSLVATSAASGGRFSIGSNEGPSRHENCPLDKTFTFANVHHAFRVEEGAVTFTMDKESAILKPGEITYIPRGQSFSISFTSRYAKAYMFIAETAFWLCCQRLADHISRVVSQKDQNHGSWRA